jgi:hypothetical protein
MQLVRKAKQLPIRQTMVLGVVATRAPIEGTAAISGYGVDSAKELCADATSGYMPATRLR